MQVSAVVWEDPCCPCDLSGGGAVRAFGARLLFFLGEGACGDTTIAWFVFVFGFHANISGVENRVAWRSVRVLAAFRVVRLECR